MKKLLLLFAFTSLLTINGVAQQAPTITIGLNGVTTVKFNGSFYAWDLEYGPPGFTTGTGTEISNIQTNTKELLINPFIDYDIRVRSKPFYISSYTAWYSYNFTNCTTTTVPVDHFQNFNTEPTLQCWRGYVVPYNLWNSSAQAVYSTTVSRSSTGGSIRLSNSSITKTVVVVAPKLENLSTTKKISFWVRGYQTPGLSVGTLSSPYDLNTFNTLQTITTTATQSFNWVEVTVNFDSYNGTDQYIAFKYAPGASASSSSVIYIDDFTYHQQCYNLENFSLSNIGENSAQLNFTAPEGQTEWEVWLKRSTYSPQTIMVTSNSALLENLVADADYQVKVRAKCGDNNFSEWTETLSFHTPCVPMTSGFEYSFESNQLDPCWKTITTSTASVLPILSSGTNNNVIPLNGTHMLRMNNSHNGNQAYLVSRYVDDLAPNKRVKFFMIADGDDNFNTSALIIGTMSNPTDASTFVPLKTISPQEMSEMYYYEPYDYWKMHSIALDNYNPVNNHHYIAFKHGSNSGGSSYAKTYFYIDDYSYGNIPLCHEPLSLKATVNYGLVQLSWTGSADSYQIEYGPEGFTPGTGSGTLGMSSTNILDITSLPNDNNKYDFYVRSICGDEFSAWSERRRFKTKCEGVTVGYTYGFENDVIDSINECWTRLTATNSPNGVTTSIISRPSRFIRTTSAVGGTVPINPHTGTKMVVMNSLEIQGADNEYNRTVLVLPRINDLENLSLLKFWANFYTLDDGTPKTLVVGTMSNPDDYTTFVPFTTFTVTTQDQHQWKEYSVDFSSYNGSNKYIAIKQGQQNGQQTIYFDDFSLTSLSCPTVTGLSAHQTGEDSAILSWQDNADTQPIAYEILIDGQTITTSTNPYPISGLAMYGHNFKVRNVCSSGVYGEWSQPYPFRISCLVMAPFVENFDTYPANGTLYDEDWCWIQYEYENTSVVSACIDNRNSCPNTLNIKCNLTGSEQFLGTGMITSPYLPDFDNTKKIRFFAVNSSYYYGSDFQGLIVGTMANPLDQSTFIPFHTIYLDPSATYGREYEIDFSSYTGSDKHIAIKAIAIDGTSTLIDNFRYIRNDCNEPLNIQLTSIADTYVIAEWEGQGNSQNSIEFGPVGFIPGTGTIITINGNDTASTISGLVPQTEYQFYITSQCPSNGTMIQGPFKFKTTCIDFSLPYLQTFAGMTAYGQDLLPECYRLIGTGVKSNNTSVLNTTTTPDSMVSGTNDNNFLFAEGDMKVIMPTFDLVAGTSYSFSIMGRKEYAYNNSTFLYVEAGRGNAIYNMNTKLSAENPNFNDIEYKPMKFVFTPLVSGKYAFQTRITTGSSSGFFLDDFAVKEGYNNSITNNTVSFNFNNGMFNDAILLEGTQNSTISVQGNVNGYVSMTGGTNSNTWIDDENTTGRMQFNTNQPELWTNNENFITKINMKVNALTMSSLFMNFKLKQTYASTGEESLFRVVVNGNIIGNVIVPAQSENNYTVYEFDLTPFIGGDIRISLQHLGRNIGDDAHVDDIQFSETALLSNEDHQFSNFKIYPNPATNNITLQSQNNISLVKILNVSGQQLYNSEYNANEVTLDISAFSAGIYFIRVYSGEKYKIFKVLKN